MTDVKAAVMADFEKPLEIRSFPLPEEVEPKAALVKIQIAGVCGTDIHLWKGQLRIPRPIILGHESAGVIVKLGSELKHDWAGRPLKEGDRVVWTAGVFCGECYNCRVLKRPTRCLNRKAYGISYSTAEPPHLLGGYAEYIYLKPNSAIFKLPDELSIETVVGAGCGFVTAIHGIERVGINWMDNVVVQGTGPVGLGAIAVARDRGAGSIIAIGGPKHRLETARRFGADHTIDIDEVKDPGERVRLVRSLTEGRGADVVLECVGLPPAVPEGFEMCRDDGRYLVLGHYGDAGPTQINPHIITRKELTVFGSWAYEARHQMQAIDFLSKKQKTYPFASLITHKFPLEKVNDALQATATWSSVKSAIIP